MHVPVIRSDEDHQAALGQLEEWVRADDSDLNPLIDALGTLISKYEDQHHRVPPPDPIQAIRGRLNDLDLSQNELAQQLGLESGRLSEVMSRKRLLTLTMIRRVHDVLGIPAEVLIRPYDIPARSVFQVSDSSSSESEG